MDNSLAKELLNNSKKYNDTFYRSMANRLLNEEYEKAKPFAEEEFNLIKEKGKATLEDFKPTGLDPYEYSKTLSNAVNKDTNNLIKQYEAVTQRLNNMTKDTTTGEYYKLKILQGKLEEEIKKNNGDLYHITKNLGEQAITGLQDWAVGTEKALIAQTYGGETGDKFLDLASLATGEKYTPEQREQAKQQMIANTRKQLTKSDEEMIKKQQLRNQMAYGDTLAGYAGDTAYVLGNMAVPILIGVTTGQLAGSTGASLETASKLSQVGSLASMYETVYGNSYMEAIDEGANTYIAGLYASSIASLEVATELIGGETLLSLMVGRPTTSILGKLSANKVNSIRNKLVKALVASAIDIGGESVEESITGFLDPVVRKTLLGGEDLSITELFGDAYKDAVGALGSSFIFMGLGRPAMINQVNKLEAKTIAQIQQAPLTVEKQGELIRQIQQITADARLGIAENYDKIHDAVYKEIGDSYMRNSQILKDASLLQRLTGISDADTARVAEQNGFVFPENRSVQEILDVTTKQGLTYDRSTFDEDIEKLKASNKDITEITPAIETNKAKANIIDNASRIGGKQFVLADIKTDDNSKIFGVTSKGSNNVYINSNLSMIDTLSATYHEIGHIYADKFPNVFKTFKSSFEKQNADNLDQTLRDYNSLTGTFDLGKEITEEQRTFLEEEIFGDQLATWMSTQENQTAIDQSTKNLFSNLREIGNKLSNKYLGTELNNKDVSAYDLNKSSYLDLNIVDDPELENKLLSMFSNKETKTPPKRVEKSQKSTPKKTVKVKAEKPTSNKTESDLKIEQEYAKMKGGNQAEIMQMIAREKGLKNFDVKKPLSPDFAEAKRMLDYLQKHNGKMPDSNQYSRREVDSEGNRLTKEQIEFFKDVDPLLRNSKGQLLVLYHGTPYDFTVFDREMLGENSWEARYVGEDTMYGFYLTPNKKFAERFIDVGKKGKQGKVLSVYLNAKKVFVHPYGAQFLYSGEELDNIAKEYVRIYDTEEGDTFKELQEMVEEGRKENPEYSFWSALFDLAEWGWNEPFEGAEDEVKLLKEKGYDAMLRVEGDAKSLIENTDSKETVVSFIAFEPNQIKLTTNEHPTDNVDIRFSQRRNKDDGKSTNRNIKEAKNKPGRYKENSINLQNREATINTNSGTLESNYKSNVSAKQKNNNDSTSESLTKINEVKNDIKYYNSILKSNYDRQMQLKDDIAKEVKNTTSKKLINLNKQLLDLFDENEQLREKVNMLQDQLDTDVLENRSPELANKMLEEEYGITEDFNKAGFILTDGKMPDFSRDANGIYGEHRQVDHYEVESTGYNLTEFIKLGNIRLKPEAGGFELYKKPTKEQLTVLKRYIDEHLKDTYKKKMDRLSFVRESHIFLDILRDGRPPLAEEYSIDTPTDKILSDLETYFETGEYPENKYNDFFYSQRKEYTPQELDTYNFKENTEPTDDLHRAQFRDIKEKVNSLLTKYETEKGYEIVAVPNTKHLDRVTIKIIKNGKTVKSIQVYNKDVWNAKDTRIAKKIRISDYKKSSGLISAVDRAIRAEFDPYIVRTREEEYRKTIEAQKKMTEGIKTTSEQVIKEHIKEEERLLSVGRNVELRLAKQLNTVVGKVNKLVDYARIQEYSRQFTAKEKTAGVSMGKEYRALFIGLRENGMKIEEAFKFTKLIYDESRRLPNAIQSSLDSLEFLRKKTVYNKLPAELKAKIDAYRQFWSKSGKRTNLTLAKQILTDATIREYIGQVAITNGVKAKLLEAGKADVDLVDYLDSVEKAEQFSADLQGLVAQVKEFIKEDKDAERAVELLPVAEETADEVATELKKNYDSKLKNFKRQLTNQTLLRSQMTFKTETQATMGGNIKTKLMVIHDNLQSAEIRKKTAVMSIYNILNEFMTDAKGVNKLLGVENWKKDISKSLSRNSEWIKTGVFIGDMELLLPKSMIMSLAMHLENDQNMSHISGALNVAYTDKNGKTHVDFKDGGGVRIPNQSLYKQGKIDQAYDAGRTVKLSYDQVQQIVSLLNDEERQFVEATKKIFNYTTQLINEVSNNIYGYDIATVANYFPIHVWKAGTSIDTFKNMTPEQRAKFDALTFLLSAGWLQDRTTSYAPIYLENIAEVIDRATNHISTFYGYAEALRDNNIIFNTNYKEPVEFGKGQETSTLREALGQLSTSYMEDYNKLTRFIVGAESIKDGGFRSLMAMNTLTFNIGTWLTQPMSFFNTIKYYTSSQFLSAVNPFNNNVQLNSMIRQYYADLGIDTSDMNTYELARAFISMATPMLDYRALRYKTPEIRALYQKGLRELLGAHGIEAFDNIAVTAVTRMQAWVIAQDPNIKFGSEEYFKRLGASLTQILVETQPEFSQVNRANMFRSNNGVLRMLSLFGTPANQMFNNFAQSWMEVMYQKREGNKAGFKSALNSLAKSIAGIIVSSILVGLVRALRDTVRTDSDDTEFEQRWVAQSVIALLGPTLILDDVAQLIMSENDFGGMNSYDFNTPETTFMNGFTNLYKKTAQLFNGEVSPAKKTTDMIKALGVITPIDTKGVTRDVVALMKVMSPDAYNSYQLQQNTSAYKKWLENQETDMAEFYSAYQNTRTDVLESKYGYVKADKEKGTKSNLKESREQALKDVLKDQRKVNQYMQILFGYKE